MTYLDHKASPKLVGTMLQHSFQYANVKAFQHMRHLKEDLIVLAQHLDEAHDEKTFNCATTLSITQRQNSCVQTSHLDEKMARLIKLFNSQRAAFKLFLRLIMELLVCRCNSIRDLFQCCRQTEIKHKIQVLHGLCEL